MEKWGLWDHRGKTHEAQVFIRSLEISNVYPQGFCQLI